MSGEPLSTDAPEAPDKSSSSSSPDASPTDPADAAKPKRNRGGRPSGLTPEVQERICLFVRAGNFFATACALAGVPEDTAKEWLRRGRGTHATRATNAQFAQFARAVKNAEAEAEARNLLIIQQAAPKDWTAAAWYLERKHPENWARQGNYSDRLGKMTDEQLDAAAARYLGGAGAAATGSDAPTDDSGQK